MSCLPFVEMKFVEIFHYTTGVAHTWDLFGLRVSRLSTYGWYYFLKKSNNWLKNGLAEK